MKKKYFLLLVFFLASICHAQWIQTNGPEGGMVNCLVSDGDNVFAGTSGGLYFSNDFGKSWKLLNNGLPISEVTSFAIDGSIVYVGTTLDGIYRLDDYGKTWKSINNGLEKSFGTLNVLSIAISENNIIISIFGKGLFLSKNLGENWVRVASELVGHGSEIRLRSSGKSLIAFDMGGSLFSSTDGGLNWEMISSVIFPTCLELIDDKIFIGKSFGGLLLSSDGGKTWVDVRNRLPGKSIVNSIKSFGQDIYTAVFGEGVLVSSDYGNSWQNYQNGLPEKLHVTDFAKLGETLLLSSLERGIYCSTNGGQTWSPSNNGLLASQVMEIQSKFDNLYSWTPDGMFRSTDNGESWFNIIVGLPTNQEVFTFGSNAIRMDLGETSSVFSWARSDDIWSVIKKVPNYNSSHDYNSQIAIKSKIIIGGWNSGIFITPDSGNTWELINQGLPQLQISCLAYDDSFLYAGTRYNGVWKRPISEIIKSIPLPEDFVLKQNYPNPFNISTTIVFSLPKDSKVDIKIFNILGEEVTTLVTEYLPRGEYQKVWYANEMASGVYLCRLEVEKFKTVKKMILVK